MEAECIEKKYRHQLIERLKTIRFDRDSNVTASLELAFFPVKIDEGRFAFQSYSEQIFHAKQLSEAEGIYDDRHRAQRFVERRRTVQDAEKIRKRFYLNVDEPPADQSVMKADLSTFNTTSELYYRDFSGEDNQGKEKNHAVEFELKNEYKDKYAETSVKKKPDVLFLEEDFPHYSLVARAEDGGSRILVMASAGHGKTTLLRRLALYYCRSVKIPKDVRDNHREVQKEYDLTGSFIPCIILLRNIEDTDFEMDQAIEKSIEEVFRNAKDDENEDEKVSTDDIKEWITGRKEDLLLLIDGLDELTDDGRLKFLNSLQKYLLSNPKANVIMTSRVAGLTKPVIMNMLREMNFRGRSMLPFTDSEAEEYSEKWIRNMNLDEEQRESLEESLYQVLHRREFAYLKNFMRTPLELLAILRRLKKGNASLNRYQLFYDMMWELLTNHLEYDLRQLAFNDTMTFLGLIAYHVQLKGTLFISVKELDELEDQFLHLSFYTDLLKNKTAEDFNKVLDDLAANVGIVEKSENSEGEGYTFPIRAYQEFLTAYACCHLKLDSNRSRPDPRASIMPYRHDTRWMNILNFVLLDLESSSNQQKDFNLLITDIFEDVGDLQQLSTIIEAGVSVTKENAQTLFGHLPVHGCFDEAAKNLIYVCMNTESAPAYLIGLKKAYKSDPESSVLLEAYSLAQIIWVYRIGESAAKDALNFLNTEVTSLGNARVGAAMICHLTKCCLGEELDEYTQTVKKDLMITERLSESLVRNALSFRDILFVEALTTLWVTEQEGFEKIPGLLNSDLAEIVMEDLAGRADRCQSIFYDKKDWMQVCNDEKLTDLFYVLGSFPINDENRSRLSPGNKNFFITAIIEFLYKYSEENFNLDQTALAVASLYYFWSDDDFAEALTYLSIGTNPGIRRRNHFELVKSQLGEYEGLYNKKKNVITRKK